MTEPTRPPLLLRPLSEVQPRAVSWLKPGLIPLRAITLVAGVGGLGKSTWLAGVAAETSRGDLLDGAPGDVILVSFEDPAAEMLRPRVEAANGDLSRIHELYFDGGDLEQVTLPRDLQELEACVRDVNARLVVIDPVVASIDVTLDAHRDQHVRHVLRSLRRVAEDASSAVVIVGHLNKAPSTDAYIKVANSVAFWNASRSVVLFTEDEASEDLRLVAQRKANWSRMHSVERYRVEEIVLPDALDPATGKPITTSRMSFVEVAEDVNGADVLAPPRTAGKTGTAETFLKVALADGEWHQSAALKDKAKALLDVSEPTVKRAAEEIGVENKREGWPAKTWWRLKSAHDNSQLSDLTVNTAQPPASRDLTAPSQLTSEARDELTGEPTASTADEAVSGSRGPSQLTQLKARADAGTEGHEGQRFRGVDDPDEIELLAALAWEYHG